MTMILKNSNDPLRNGKKEHVIAVGIRPIRHRHASFMTRDEASDANQAERYKRGKNAKPTEPSVIGSGHRATFKKKKPLRPSGTQR